MPLGLDCEGPSVAEPCSVREVLARGTSPPILRSTSVPTTQADLNAKPKLPFADGSFDVVTCVVSVDYLNKPKEVMAEVARVLKPKP